MTAVIYKFPGKAVDNGVACVASPPDFRLVLTLFMGLEPAKADWIVEKIGHRYGAIFGDGRRPVIDTYSSFPAEVQRVIDVAAAHHRQQMSAALLTMIAMAGDLYDATRGEGGAA